MTPFCLLIFVFCCLPSLYDSLIHLLKVIELMFVRKDLVRLSRPQARSRKSERDMRECVRYEREEGEERREEREIERECV